MSDNPIFIVGAPRSGTTLLAAMLSSHTRIGCGPETQFFNKIKPHELQQAIDDPVWPRNAVALISSLTLANQKVYELFDLSLEEIENFLSNRDPSIRAMLESLTKNYATKSGKPRWSEKTPNHLLHLDLIRQEFPQSPIIRIIRDPRDSAMSMRKLPWASESVLANCYLWDQWFQQSRPFFEQDTNTLTLRYEDLVLNPDQELQNICQFIGEEFEPVMLWTAKSGKNVSSPNEPWKAQVSSSLDSSRLSVWKKELSPLLQEAATLFCFPGIEEFGYEFAIEPTQTLQVYPFNRSVIERYEKAIINIGAYRVRLIKSSAPIASDNLLVFPDGEESRRRRLRWFTKPIGILKSLVVLFLRNVVGLSTIWLPLRPEQADKYVNKVFTQVLGLRNKTISVEDK